VARKGVAENGGALCGSVHQAVARKGVTEKKRHAGNGTSHESRRWRMRFGSVARKGKETVCRQRKPLPTYTKEKKPVYVPSTAILLY
jgi:hypothetical protein